LSTIYVSLNLELEEIRKMITELKLECNNGTLALLPSPIVVVKFYVLLWALSVAIDMRK